ncbi:hypothetical protein [Butyricimonas synergistica]|uniref:hypothetical protein n=2 Tax=Odoribacteraceae TaxID=1853231 RepID=UPI0003686F7E|nr:hypothetical protein [Butyricimonas synergistica]
MEDDDIKRESPRKYHRDGITHYYRMGKPCRMSSTRDKADTPPTDNQIKYREALESAVQFSVNFFLACPALVPAWNLYGAQMGKDRLRAFNKENNPVIDATSKGVNYFPDFRFSRGDLVPPREARVSRIGWKLFIEWEIPACPTGRAAPDDELLVGYFYESRPDSPQLVASTGFTRQERKAQVILPSKRFPVVEDVHVFLLFRRADYQSFSESRYVGLIRSE